MYGQQPYGVYSLQYTSPEQVTEPAPSGCYVSGLYLEGARWDLKNSCLQRSHPKVLIEELPILRIIPIEAHQLKLVVCDTLVGVCMLSRRMVNGTSVQCDCSFAPLYTI